MQQVTVIVGGMRRNGNFVSAVFPTGVYPMFDIDGGQPHAVIREMPSGEMLCLPVGERGCVPCGFPWPVPPLTEGASDYDRKVFESRRRIHAAEIGRGSSGRAKLIVHSASDILSDSPYCLLYAPLGTSKRGNIASGDWTGDVQEVSGTMFRSYHPQPAAIVTRGFHTHPKAGPGQMGAQWLFLLPKGVVLRLDPTSGDQHSVYYLFDGTKLHLATPEQRKELEGVEGSPWPVVQPTEQAQAWLSRCRPYEGVSYPDMLRVCMGRMVFAGEVELKDYVPQWDLLREYHSTPQSAMDALLAGDKRGAEKWVQEVVKHNDLGNAFGWPADLVEICKIARRITR